MAKHTLPPDERWEYCSLNRVLNWLNQHDSEFINARINWENISIELFDTYENRRREFLAFEDLKNWLGY